MKPGDSRYWPLFNHLRQSGQAEVTLTFAQIEGLLGGALPASARHSRGWWSNRRSGPAQAQAWMQAGYHVEGLDLAQAQVTFRKPERVYQVERKGDTVQWTGELIKGLRQHLGLNQAQLAEKLGVRQQTISEWETGLYAPSRKTSKYLTMVAAEEKFLYQIEP